MTFKRFVLGTVAGGLTVLAPASSQARPRGQSSVS
jgi:hypothetical protein